MKSQRLLFLFFLSVFFAIIVKLFYHQVLAPASDIDNNYLHTNKLLPERGIIYDRNGDPLAVNSVSYRLFFEPKKVKDPYTTIHRLDDILHIGTATLEERLDMSKDWVSVKAGISKTDEKRITALNLPGIGLEDQTQRYYPEGSLSAHLLGFVGKDKNGNNTGYFGIEGYYNQDLVGLPGVIKSERDFLGRPILIGTQEKVDAENGRSLYLTIDKSVQEIVKNKLREGLDRYEAKSGCAIFADPSTMEILALSCLPDFDVEKYYEFGEEYFKNPAISDVYEPGSIFKPLIVAAGIEEKKIKPNDIYNETGPIESGGYTIRTWNNKYEGPITMTRILEKSSNVGMVYIGHKLGKAKIYDYVNKLGFGQLTGIDLQGETPSFLKPKNEWYPIDYDTATFGQGIAVTPIQILRAFASVINGGKLMEPHIVYKVGDGSDQIQIEPQLQKQVFSKHTSDILKKMLVSVVEKGEIKWLKPEGFVMGGKTGTAQIPIEGHYDSSKTNASFVGFAPANNPKFIGLIAVKEPGTSQYGSETAAPIFFDIANELLLYYNIAPE